MTGDRGMSRDLAILPPEVRASARPPAHSQARPSARPAPTGVARTAAGAAPLRRLLAWLVGEEPAAVRLPARVRREIQRQQEDSEILIGWVQICAIVTFAVLYALAPKTFPPDAPFEPVPVTLTAYAVFTVVRLYLAYARRLPGWFLTLSVVIDMAVLLVTIWSFHLQYQQPPGFYLKAPTLLYAFIIIALRTLRFEARYVLLAGATAALGWLGLVAYAVLNDPTGSPITRDYVQYMMSWSVLLGAEFDKVISIVTVTLVLAVALRRGQALLVRAFAEQAAAADLSRFFAPEVARRITSAEERVRPGQGELRDAAVMFVDLRGFSAFVERLPPDEVIALLGEYQTRLVPVIRRHGGSIDKFLGDGIMASFGAAPPSTTYAADALRAAEAVAAEARLWAAGRRRAGRPTPPVGAAVAAGRVLFGAVGDAHRLEYTVIGDPVNLAAKLEKHSKVESVAALTTAATLALAEAQGFAPGPNANVETRPGRRVAGVDGPLDLVVLVRRTADGRVGAMARHA
jgi:adenylate cyclase